MPDPADINLGTFVRWELMTTQPAAAKAFYQQLWGWQAEDRELADGARYTHLSAGNYQYIGGLYEMSGGFGGGAMAAHWTPFISVAAVAEALAKAKSLGAFVTTESFAFEGLGEMALIQDPTGAPLGLWQDGTGSGGPTLAWHELSTTSPERAAAFYTAMFGWELQEEAGGDLNLKTFTMNGVPVAGILALGPRFQAVPSHWLPYFGVGDLAGAEAAVAAGGGRLLAAAASPAFGKQCVVQDPQGAVFGIMPRPPQEMHEPSG